VQRVRDLIEDKNLELYISQKDAEEILNESKKRIEECEKNGIVVKNKELFYSI